MLDILECQNCNSSIDFVPITSNFGIYKCRCEEYPYINGILYLKEKNKQLLLKLIKEKKTDLAFKEALFSEKIEKIDGAIKKDNLLKKISRFKTDDFLFYLKIRQLSDSFNVAISLIPNLKRGITLDYGASLGHIDFYLQSHLINNKIVCLDSSFSSLFYNKKYFTKNQIYICHDSEKHLPFKKGIFTNIFSCDTLHYIKNKLALVKEFNRISNQNSVHMHIHCHNSKASNLVAGYPLAKEEYQSLFKNFFVYAENEFLYKNVDVPKAFVLSNKKLSVYNADYLKEYKEVKIKYNVFEKIRYRKLINEECYFLGNKIKKIKIPIRIK